VLAASEGDERLAAERDLRRALEAPRVNLLSQFTALPCIFMSHLGYSNFKLLR